MAATATTSRTLDKPVEKDDKDEEMPASQPVLSIGQVSNNNKCDYELQREKNVQEREEMFMNLEIDKTKKEVQNTIQLPACTAAPRKPRKLVLQQERRQPP